MKKRALALFALFLAWTGRADALPQFTVQSAASCESCHIRPAGWDNPEVRLRKCTLSCNGCHVNPTGGGLKNAGGLFFGRRDLPLLARKFDHPQLRLDEQNRPVNPMNSIAGQPIPEPNTDARFDGIRADPTFQYGGDFRGMAFVANLEGDDGGGELDETRLFPMQADLYLAWKPYKPSAHNRGRLTLYGSAGAVGQRFYGEDGTDDLEESLRLKETFLLYDNLPNQLYVKAGRFIPAFGWRLDDHTAYIRQEQTFDAERWVEGVEVGINPNYPYLNVSAYYFDPDKYTYGLDDDDKGFGGAISGGIRRLSWQLGASAVYENRDFNDELWVGAQWSLNFFRAYHPWKSMNVAPLIYLGEVDLRYTDGQELQDADDGNRSGVTMLHELDYFIRDGLRLMARYDWQDADLDADDTHRERFTVGVAAHLFSFAELIAQYRYNAGFVDAVTVGNPNRKNEGILQIHLWY